MVIVLHVDVYVLLHTVLEVRREECTRGNGETYQEQLVLGPFVIVCLLVCL